MSALIEIVIGGFVGALTGGSVLFLMLRPRGPAAPLPPPRRALLVESGQDRADG